MEEQEEQGDLDALWRETVGITGAVALDEAVPFELAQVVTELVEAVGLLREIAAGEDGVMDLPGRPAADLRATVQEDLEQAHNTRLVEFEAGVGARTAGGRAGEVWE